jgi:hypothetical protein
VTDSDWTVDYWPGGWVRAKGPDLTVYLRVGRDPESQRALLRVCAAIVTGGKPVTEAMWRSVPLAKIEQNMGVISAFTSPDIDSTISALSTPADIQGFSIEALERYFDESDRLPVQGTIHTATGASDVSLAEQFQLSRPPGGRLTDEYLKEVAAHYLAAVEAKRPPAPAVAAAADVSTRTVHGWIAEARRRGILPAATKGRAG